MDSIPVFPKKSLPKIIGTHFLLYFGPILHKNLQIPLFYIKLQCSFMAEYEAKLHTIRSEYKYPVQVCYGEPPHTIPAFKVGNSPRMSQSINRGLFGPPW